MTRGEAQWGRGFEQVAGVIPEVRLVFPPRLLVGLRHVDADAPADLLVARRIALSLTALAEILGALPPQLEGGQRRQHHVGVALLCHPLHGLRAAGAGDPDGRMRLLVGLRPQIDVAEAVVLAFPGERSVSASRP